MRESQHKPSIEIGKAQKVVKLCESCRFYPIPNDLDISLIYMNIFLINYVAQILYLVHVKG